MIKSYPIFKLPECSKHNVGSCQWRRTTAFHPGKEVGKRVAWDETMNNNVWSSLNPTNPTTGNCIMTSLPLIGSKVL